MRRIEPEELDQLDPGSDPVIVGAPGASLSAAVSLMQRSERVAGVILDGSSTAGLFSLDQLAPGAQIRSCTVCTYAEKSRCLAQIAELVRSVGATATCGTS